jgi:hypothetical protein
MVSKKVISFELAVEPCKLIEISEENNRNNTRRTIYVPVSDIFVLIG